MASPSEHALDSKQNHEQLHVDSDFLLNVVRIEIDHIDPDAKISGSDLSDSCSDSHDDWVNGNVGGDDGGNVGGDGYNDGYNDKDSNNEVWGLWDENNHDFYMVLFQFSSGYKPR
jgi:hypothetical protein